MRRADGQHGFRRRDARAHERRLSDARLRRAQMAAALAATRREFALEARQGRGGRDAQARYAAEMDDLVTAARGGGAAATPQPLVVCALGGYGRRTLCLHSDIDLLILFGTRHRPGRRALRQRRAAAALGSAADGRPARARARRLRRARHQQHRVPARRCSTRGRSPATSLCSSALRGQGRRGDARESAPRRRLAARAGRAAARAVQRHASTSSSPTSRTRRAGCATSRRSATCSARRRARATAIARAPPARSAKPRTSCCGSARVLHAEAGRDANVLTHELQERVADALGCRGRRRRASASKR